MFSIIKYNLFPHLDSNSCFEEAWRFWCKNVFYKFDLTIMKIFSI